MRAFKSAIGSAFMRARTPAPAATSAITAPEATRARAIGKPGTFTWQTATSSS